MKWGSRGLRIIANLPIASSRREHSRGELEGSPLFQRNEAAESALKRTGWRCSRIL